MSEKDRIINTSHPRPRTITSALKASNFDYKNPEHVAILRSMGINIEFMDGEKLQLVHNSATAYSDQLGVEGMIFMKEITDHAKQMAQGTILFNFVGLVLISYCDTWCRI